MGLRGELIGDPVRIGLRDHIIGITRGRLTGAGFVSYDVTLPVSADLSGAGQFGELLDARGSVGSPAETKLNRI